MFKLIAERLKKVLDRPSLRSSDGVAGLFSGHEQLSEDEIHIIALIKSLLPEDTAARERSLELLRGSLERQEINDRKIGKLLSCLRQIAPESPDKVLPALKKYDPLQQRMVLENLLGLIIDHDEYRVEQYKVLAGLSEGLGISKAEFEDIADTVKKSIGNRGKILRSGTGIILALIVIGLFVLVATWLSSLLFGLVLAYIFLPLEQFFERQIRKEPGRVTRWLRRLNFLKLIRDKLNRKSHIELSDEEIEMRKRRAVTAQATTLTVSCVVIAFLTLVIFLSVLSFSYIISLRNEYRAARAGNLAAVQTSTDPNTAVNTAAEQQSAEKTAAAVNNSCPEHQNAPAQAAGKNPVRSSFFASMSNNIVVFLDNIKHRFESLPLVKRIINKLSVYLADGRAEEQVTAMLLKRSGGIWSFIGKFIAGFAAFLLNLLLTFFFFSLILNKLALFINSRKNKNQRASSYLIQTVFNGKWLPQMSEENMREGDRIVGEVVNKLRIWLRGYLTMIAIDYCVYTTVFMLLGIPYAPILGAIAAVGILLPYIGPVSSALLTVLVTLAVGGANVTVLQIAGALSVYLIHNGIIEQFFIYPWIIGESLGLSTLETIIVVLLGGILAGIPGMIFAMPVASVIKYLVPQIYRCWR